MKTPRRPWAPLPLEQHVIAEIIFEFDTGWRVKVKCACGKQRQASEWSGRPGKGSTLLEAVNRFSGHLAGVDPAVTGILTKAQQDATADADKLRGQAAALLKRADAIDSLAADLAALSGEQAA